MSEVLNGERVESVLKACLHDDDDPQDVVVIGEGIVESFGFRPDRLAENRDAIREMLAELPDTFRVGPGGGGGWSFLNACDDRHGEQWTGFHRTMNMLFCLGLAAGFVKCVLPREMWAALPGGMPYYQIDLDA